MPSLSSAQSPSSHLSSPVLSPALQTARPTAFVDPARTQDITFVLPLRNPDELQQTLAHLYTPGDPLFGRYMTAAEFAGRFGPDQATIDQVARYAAAQGLNVVDVSPNGTMIHVRGSAAAVSHAVGVRLMHWTAASGASFVSADREPVLPAEIAGNVLTITGLDNIARQRPHSRMTAATSFGGGLSPLLTGTGHGSLSPNDVRSIYGLTGTPYNGAGQTLAIVTLDTYKASDISTFTAAYGGSSVPIENVGVDNFNTATPPGGGASETVLDIDMLLALAPAASRVLVYENANTTQGTLDVYNKIATDNRAKQISTSWGSSEQYNLDSVRQAESNVFAQMAAQGQSFFAASGDAGAYDNQSTGSSTASLSVDDPASVPLVTGVGGTTLRDTAGIGYLSESAWFSPTDTSWGPYGTGGGGGISHYWQIPPWQVGAFSAAVNPQGSATMRNVPDVSLFGDFNSGGYSIYFSDPASGANWYSYNGTSAAAPLWASFTALVNQARAAKGLPSLGFANPALYSLAKDPTAYARDFHDIKDGTTNAYYHAVPGYDDATGLGSFIGASLIADLAALPAPAVKLATLTVTPSTDAITAPFTIAVGLTAPAPAGGMPVSITLGGVAWNVMVVPAGQSAFSMQFKMTATGAYTIGAICGGVAKSASLTVVPVSVSAFSVSPNPVIQTNSVTATATLNGPAPAGGAQVTLTWNGAAWSKIVIPAGAATGSLSLKPLSVGSITTAAAFGGVTKTFALTVSPVAVSAFTVAPNPVILTNAVTATVTLTAPAPTGGSVVPLTWNGAAWGSITVPAAATTASLSLKPVSVGAITTAAALGGVTKTFALTVTTVNLSAMTLTPATVIYPSPTVIKVTLNAVAPAAGAKVAILSNGAAWTTITVPAGQTTASLSVAPSAKGTFTVTATYNAGTAAATLVAN